jgi:hypothetical protein
VFDVKVQFIRQGFQTAAGRGRNRGGRSQSGEVPGTSNQRPAFPRLVLGQNSQAVPLLPTVREPIHLRASPTRAHRGADVGLAVLCLPLNRSVGASKASRRARVRLRIRLAILPALSSLWQSVDSSDLSTYDALATELTGLSTCEALVDWERRAKEEADGLRLAVENANAQIEPVLKERADLLESLDRAKFEFSQRPFLKRIARDHSAEEAIKARISVLDQWISSAHSEIAQFEKLSNQLSKIVDFVAEIGPRTLADKSQILSRLRQQKKELQIQKRELTTKMTAMRRIVRDASATAGKRGFFGVTGTFGDGKSSDGLAWYDPSLAAGQRRAIRAVKEDALRPLESEKTDIEQRILALDRHILFVEQFKS